MTARNPQPANAQGACSREEPQPKLSPASRTAPRSIRGGSRQIRVGAAVRQIAPARKTIPRPTQPIGHFQKRAGMIWSVSTSSHGSGMTREVSVLNGCMYRILQSSKHVRGSATRP